MRGPQLPGHRHPDHLEKRHRLDQPRKVGPDRGQLHRALPVHGSGLVPDPAQVPDPAERDLRRQDQHRPAAEIVRPHQVRAQRLRQEAGRAGPG